MQQTSHLDRICLVDEHIFKQMPVVRFTHAEHLLHGATGKPDFLPDDPAPFFYLAVGNQQLDPVCIVNGDSWKCISQGIDRRPLFGG
jgi:hypothetical protein